MEVVTKSNLSIKLILFILVQSTSVNSKSINFKGNNQATSVSGSWNNKKG